METTNEQVWTNRSARELTLTTDELADDGDGGVLEETVQVSWRVRYWASETRFQGLDNECTYYRYEASNCSGASRIGEVMVSQESSRDAQILESVLSDRIFYDLNK
jgi:hypothetical protein